MKRNEIEPRLLSLPAARAYLNATQPAFDALINDGALAKINKLGRESVDKKRLDEIADCLANGEPLTKTPKMREM